MRPEPPPKTSTGSLVSFPLLRGLLILVYCTLSPASPAAEPRLPDFGLHTPQGAPVSIESQIGRGHWTLLMFWAMECPICRRQEPLISAFHEAHKDQDARVIGISIDGLDRQAEIRQFLARHPVSHPNYIGSLTLIGANFPALAREAFRGTPTYLLFSPKGELLAVNPGPVRMEALESFIQRHR